MTPDVPGLRPRRAWFYLSAAIALELVGIVFLKRSQGLVVPVPAVLGYPAYGAAFALLSRVMQVMPASTTYMLWNGIGAVGVTLGGWLLFGDSLTPLTAAGTAVAVSGTLLINVGGTGDSARHDENGGERREQTQSTSRAPNCNKGALQGPPSRCGFPQRSVGIVVRTSSILSRHPSCVSTAVAGRSG